jgi:hypothetical protein
MEMAEGPEAVATSTLKRSGGAGTVRPGRLSKSRLVSRRFPVSPGRGFSPS